MDVFVEGTLFSVVEREATRETANFITLYYTYCSIADPKFQNSVSALPRGGRTRLEPLA